jgi:RNA polymerase sigma factor (sigma-70 family)
MQGVETTTRGLRMAQGTTGDFGDWVAPHLPAMTRYAARLVGTDDRDDIVQDALERAWRRWSTFDERRGTPLAWLLAIVHDRGRRHRTRRRAPLLMPEAEAADPRRDLDLERAVAGLPPRQRQAVDLHYFVGLDVVTVAAVMGCAEGTVKATLHQARSRLRDVMGDDDE